MLGDNKLVEALKSVANLAPTLQKVADGMTEMQSQLATTNHELAAVREELEATRGEITRARELAEKLPGL